MTLTGTERVFGNTVHLITTTDARGIITYANDDFIAISGFDKDELNTLASHFLTRQYKVAANDL